MASIFIFNIWNDNFWYKFFWDIRSLHILNVNWNDWVIMRILIVIIIIIIIIDI